MLSTSHVSEKLASGLALTLPEDIVSLLSEVEEGLNEVNMQALQPPPSLQLTGNVAGFERI